MITSGGCYNEKQIVPQRVEDLCGQYRTKGEGRKYADKKRDEAKSQTVSAEALSDVCDSVKLPGLSNTSPDLEEMYEKVMSHSRGKRSLNTY